MKDKTDFLWGMYQEHTTQGRHHETQRASVTNFIIIVAGATLAFVANKGVTKDQWVLAAFLILIGIFGILFSTKQYERFRFHIISASKYKAELETIFGDNLDNIREKAKEEHGKRFLSIFIKLRLYYFWIFFHVLIVILGLVLLIMTLKA